MEEKMKIELLNENDFKIEIFEAIEFDKDFANILLNFCQKNSQFIKKNPYMHMFPIGVFVTEIYEPKKGERNVLISQQNVYVLGEIEDRIIIADNDFETIITNRKPSTSPVFGGFAIHIDKANNEFYLWKSISENATEFLSFRTSFKRKWHISVEEATIILEECFEKLNRVLNINDFINLHQIKEKLFNRLVEEKEHDIKYLKYAPNKTTN